MSVKWKILIPMIAAAVLTASLVLVSNVVQFSIYVDSRIDNELDRTLMKIQREIQLLQEKAASASLYFSNDKDIIAAIESGDREELTARSMAIFNDTGIEIGAITDTAGIVLSRPHNPGVYGDDISAMHSISAALSGETLKATECGPTINMMACAGAPIYNAQRKLIGVVAVGFRLDTEEFVDTHKRITGHEISVFKGDIRVATTLYDEEDERAVSTRAPSGVSEVVLAGNTYTDLVTVSGQDIISRYIPILTPAGNAVGMLLAGHFLTEKDSMVGTFISVGILATFILLIIIVLILMFVSKRISLPIIKKLELVHYDELTGIYNRRYYEENIKRIIKSLSRSGGILSMLMVDIDCFKKYNDTYGHKSGDDCLKCIAESLAGNVLRADDFVARYGGEEFIVVLPNTDEDGARTIADRLLNSIRQCGIPHEKSEASDYVTVSIGVVTGYPEYPQSGNDYVKRADEMLYQSKQNGKNQYSFSSMTDSQPTSLASTTKALMTMTRKKKMADVLNEIAFLFLSQRDWVIENVLTAGINLMAESIDIDEISVWRNYTKNGEVYMSHMYRWDRGAGGMTDINEALNDLPYSVYTQGFEETYIKGESVNSPVRYLPNNATSAKMKEFGVISVFITPIINNNETWGFVVYADHHSERVFDDDTANIMRSTAFLFANAVIRDQLEREVIEAEEMTRLMLDSSPICCQLWAKDLSTIECNEAAVRMYGFKDKQEYLDKFLESCSPEFQPDGQRSGEKAVKLVKQAFDEGYCYFDWMHQMPDGTPIPAEVTLIRVRYKNDYIVAGYTRDLRKMKKLEKKLEVALSEAEEANRSSSEFYMRMNHELLTPMNAIMGMTEILNRQPLAANQRMYLEEIDNASRNLLRLIHDLLGATKE